MSDKRIVTTVPGPIVLTNGSFRCTDREDMLRRCRASIVVGLSPFKLTGLSGVLPAIVVTLRRNTDGVKAAENWKSPR